MDGKFYIFSDEAGHWSQAKIPFYCRSWILISEENYLFLSGLWENKKLEMPTEKSILNNDKLIDYFINKKTKFFFTFTKLNEFYERKWTIRDNVSLALSQLEKILTREYEKKILKKLENALNQILFLHVYEKCHLENSLEAFNVNNEYSYEIYLNKPQFAENDYEEVFEEIKNKKNLKNLVIYFVKNRENDLGIKLSDSLASIFEKVLADNDNSKFKEFMKNKILPHCIGGHIGIKGINKVFYPVNKSYGSDKLRIEETEIIQKLNNLFN